MTGQNPAHVKVGFQTLGLLFLLIGVGYASYGPFAGKWKGELKNTPAARSGTSPAPGGSTSTGASASSGASTSTANTTSSNGGTRRQSGGSSGGFSGGFG